VLTSIAIKFWFSTSGSKIYWCSIKVRRMWLVASLSKIWEKEPGTCSDVYANMDGAGQLWVYLMYNVTIEGSRFRH
jgi:hypothetical protein